MYFDVLRGAAAYIGKSECDDMIISEKAYAKLNLSLDVLSRMDDGYHRMQMVLQTADLCDDLTFTINRGEGIRLTTNLKYIPSDARNIAWKAAELFLAESGISGYGISIDVKKRIPVCAGLGGGSADAAAVLRALNRAFGTGFDMKKLEKMAEKLGSDVPFCVAGGTALAEGRGVELTELPALPDCWIVICKPPFSISTPELFSQLDCKMIVCRPDTAGILGALDSGSLSGVCRRMYNVFEPVIKNGAEKIAAIKQVFLDCEALGTVMTGTGSAVFAVFDDPDAAREAARRLSDGHGRCFEARPVKRMSL